MKSFTNSGQFKKGQPSLNKGKKASTETRRKQSLARIGTKLSVETREKMKGHIPWNKGLKGINHSEETKRKMSLSHKGIPLPWLDTRGPKNVNWKGGITKIDKLCRRMPEYYVWRSKVFERDQWTCQTCNAKGYVTVHHIYGFSRILKDHNIKTSIDARKCAMLWDIDNGVTLCEPCHSLTDNYKGRGKQK